MFSKLKFSRRESRSSYQISSDNPQKDNIHNFILGIDNMIPSGIFDSPFLIEFLFPGWLMLDIVLSLREGGTFRQSVRKKVKHFSLSEKWILLYGNISRKDESNWAKEIFGI